MNDLENIYRIGKIIIEINKKQDNEKSRHTRGGQLRQNVVASIINYPVETYIMENDETWRRLICVIIL